MDTRTHTHARTDAHTHTVWISNLTNYMIKRKKITNYIYNE